MEDPATRHADLDDGLVVAIERDSGNLRVELTRYGDERIVIHAVGVQQELAEYYIGAGVSAPHPDPSLPLNVIEYAVFGPDYLELQGLRKNDSWYVWRIVARSFDIIRTRNDTGI